MSQLNQKDLRTPFNGSSIRKIRGRIDAFKSQQGAAANNTASYLSDVEGSIQDVYFAAAALAASGESISVDVQLNGVSVTVTGSPFVIDSTFAHGELVHIPMDPGASVKVGDVISVVRAYTAGGGPTPIGANVVGVEIS